MMSRMPPGSGHLNTSSPRHLPFRRLHCITSNKCPLKYYNYGYWITGEDMTIHVFIGGASIPLLKMWPAWHRPRKPHGMMTRNMMNIVTTRTALITEPLIRFNEYMHF